MTSSGSSKSVLNTKFNEMNFDEEVNEDFSALKKWMNEQSKMIRSVINFGEDGGDVGENAVRKEGTKMDVAQDEETLLKIYKRIYSNPNKLNASCVEASALSLRVQMLEDLLKKHSNTLVHAEATAGQVPTWVIEKEDFPNWAKSLRTPLVADMRKRLESGYDQLYSVLDSTSYSMNTFISVFSAIIQVDGPVLLLFSPRLTSCIQLLIPVVILADLINEAKIRNEPISVIVTTPNLLSPDVFSKLFSVDIQINRASKGIVEVGDDVVRNPASLLRSIDTASLWLNVSNGKTVHYVIDNSGDVVSAVASVARNTWQCGIEMNHRTRSLVFVHEPIHARVVDEFQKIISTQKVNDWRVNPLSACDVVVKHLQTSNLLDGVNRLGAKLISITTDFSTPTVVYDIGLSSELVAIKEANLGHVLLLVPYRSSNELYALGNNFGTPNRLFIYSNCINTVTSMMKKLNAAKVMVNSTIPHSEYELDFPWQVKCKHAAENKIANRSASYTNLKSLSRCKQWSLLSSNIKTDHLNRMFSCSNVPASILAHILAYKVDTIQESSVSLPIASTSGVAGILIGDPPNISITLLITCLSSCLLRDNSVVVVSVGSDIQEDVRKNILGCGIPDGLVGFATVGNVSDVKKIASNWDLVWVIQGDKENIAMDFLPTNSEARLLLVNNSKETFPAYNCMLAIKSAFKSCYF